MNILITLAGIVLAFAAGWLTVAGMRSSRARRTTVREIGEAS
jgi:hypothetical protein